MKIEQRYWTASEGWQMESASTLDGNASLVLVFGASKLLNDATRMAEIRARYPGTLMLGCTTAGEICGIRVRDDSIVTTAVHFEQTALKLAHTTITEGGDSRKVAKYLANALPAQQLVHVLVLSDGLKVNGSELVCGLRENLPDGVAVTGGLAGGGMEFLHTWVCADGAPEEGKIAALGFYSEHLKVGFASLGGWDAFGAERLITRSHGNILYELDGRSALELYRRYLGENNAEPADMVMFPLSIRINDAGARLVRTVMSINEDDQSITFAGDMPQGSYVRLMKANMDRLVEGAADAARKCNTSPAPASGEAELALLVSCAGRKLVLKQRIEEEIEIVREVLGNNAVLTGFYSYGEICPYGSLAGCEFHNQTMTITTFSER